MSRADQLTKMVKTISTSIADVEAAAIVDNDGLLMASSLPQEMENDSVAAMSAAMLGMSERIVSELRRGNFEVVMLRGGDGYVFIARCGPEAVLTLLANSKAKLGLVFLEAARAAKEIARIVA